MKVICTSISIFDGDTPGASVSFEDADAYQSRKLQEAKARRSEEIVPYKPSSHLHLQVDAETAKKYSIGKIYEMTLE